MSQLVQQHLVRANVFGVRLYLIKEDIPEELRDAIEESSTKIEQILKRVLDCNQRDQLPSVLDRVTEEIIELLQLYGPSLAQFVRSHPGGLRARVSQQVQNAIQMLKTLPQGQISPVLLDDLEWSLRTLDALWGLWLSLPGLSEDGGLSFVEMSEDLRSQWQAMFLLPLALEAIEQTTHHPLLEDWCDRIYWGFKKLKTSIEAKFSIQIDVWQQAGETSEERIQRFHRYASLMVSHLSNEQRQAFFDAIERR